MAVTARATWFAALMLLVARASLCQAQPDTDARGPVEAVRQVSAVYGRLMDRLLTRYDVPGGAIAVARKGQIVFQQGYGKADLASGALVTPDTLFRIASISKPITAVTILRLVEDGRLGLDDPVFDRLAHLLPRGGPADARVRDITVRQLLWHAGGWDRDAAPGYDPMFDAAGISAALGIPSPPSPSDIIRQTLTRPLDFAPGERHAYSNFGYCILGRLIEAVTGCGYEEAVRRDLLEPMGIRTMRIGAGLRSGAEETTYYGHPQEGLAESVYAGAPGQVPWEYGGFCLEALDAHGGWVASAADLVTFACCVEGSGAWRPLRPETVALMTERPSLAQWQGSDYWYGMGWLVRPVGGEANWWHNGSLPGTYTLLVRTFNHRVWAALFNSRPADDGFGGAVDGGMWQAAAEAGLL